MLNKMSDISYDDEGRVLDIGKFEGETKATVYFYDCWLNGDGDTWVDETETPFTFFVVESEDILACPELEGIYGVAIYEDEVGFVYLNKFETEAEYVAAQDAITEGVTAVQERGADHHE